MVGPAKTGWERPSEGPDREAGSLVRVLHVEDDADNAELVRVLLARDRRIDLITAADGWTGLAIAAVTAVDLILLDLGLPDMTGEEFLEVLRGSRATRDVPVVVVTADADARESPRVRAARVLAYIVKPLEIGNFTRLVDDALFPEP